MPNSPASSHDANAPPVAVTLRELQDTMLEFEATNPLDPRYRKMHHLRMNRATWKTQDDDLRELGFRDVLRDPDSRFGYYVWLDEGMADGVVRIEDRDEHVIRAYGPA